MIAAIWGFSVMSAALCAMVAATPPYDAHTGGCVFFALLFSHVALAALRWDRRP